MKWVGATVPDAGRRTGQRRQYRRRLKMSPLAAMRAMEQAVHLGVTRRPATAQHRDQTAQMYRQNDGEQTFSNISYVKKEAECVPAPSLQ